MEVLKRLLAFIPHMQWDTTLNQSRGIDKLNRRTVKWPGFTHAIIKSLDKHFVVVLRSSPLTGKSTVATLVSHKLAQPRLTKALVFHFSLLDWGLHGDFEENFKSEFSLSWDDATRKFNQNYTVHMIVDDAMALDREGNTESPMFGAYAFWNVVRQIQSPFDNNVRFLLVVGNSARYRIGTGSLSLDKDVFGSDRLHFSRDEIREYVSKWFRGNKRLGGVSEQYRGAPPYRQVFGNHLQWLTGGHVGLCAAAIEVLNEVVDAAPDLNASPERWIRMLRDGVLRESTATRLLCSSVW